MARTKQTARKSTGGKAPRKKPSSSSVAGDSTGTVRPLEPPAPMAASQRAMIEQEDTLRELFATARSDARISDPYVSLVNVAQEIGSFVYEAEDAEEAAVPKLLTRDRVDIQVGQPSIVDMETFQSRWETFSKGVFAGMNWANMFVAGGAVLSCLQAAPSPGSQGSDVDIFLYGLDTDEEANAKLKEIHERIKANSGSNSDVIRTHRAVTIIGEYPFRHVQIILKMYKSPAEVLLGFDVDSCCVGLDGTGVWVAPRARRAINKGYNLVNMTRRSLTYETRLKKYAKRGYCVAVPELDKGRIDPSILRLATKNAQGLSKLIAYEYAQLSAADAWGSARRYSRITGTMVNEYTADAIDEHESLHTASDYSDVFIPWGPRWYSRQILRLLSKKDKAQYFQQARSNFQHKHIFVSGIDAAINGPVGHEVWCIHCRSRMRLESDGSGKYAPSTLTWLRDAPAMQDFENGRTRTLMSGSFFPVIESNWIKGCYLAPGVPAPEPHPLQVVRTAATSSSSSSNPGWGSKPKATFGKKKKSSAKAAKSAKGFGGFAPQATASQYASNPFGGKSGFGSANPFSASPQKTQTTQYAANPFGGAAPQTQYAANPFGGMAKPAGAGAAPASGFGGATFGSAPVSSGFGAPTQYVTNPFGAPTGAEQPSQPSQPQPSPTGGAALSCAECGQTFFSSNQLRRHAAMVGHNVGASSAAASGPVFGGGQSQPQTHTQTFEVAPAQPATSFGYSPPQSAGSASSFDAIASQVRAAVGPGTNPMSAALILIKLMSKAGALPPSHAPVLKDLALQQDHRVWGAVDAFMLDFDVADIADTFDRIVRIVNQRR